MIEHPSTHNGAIRVTQEARAMSPQTVSAEYKFYGFYKFIWCRNSLHNIVTNPRNLYYKRFSITYRRKEKFQVEEQSDTDTMNTHNWLPIVFGSNTQLCV